MLCLRWGAVKSCRVIARERGVAERMYPRLQSQAASDFDVPYRGQRSDLGSLSLRVQLLCTTISAWRATLRPLHAAV